MGQRLSKSCRYSNKTEHSYKAKIWCRKKASKCFWLVSTSKPRTLAQDSRYTIRDDPSSGFTNVPMAELKEKDSGSYQRATKGSKGGTTRKSTCWSSQVSSLLREEAFLGCPGT